jgi:hypothetical protein
MNEIISQFISNQLPNIPDEYKLKPKDFAKISKNIDIDIFQKNTCTLWHGVLCNKDKPKKGVYINYYFNRKKTTLHRLLYINFVGSLDDKEYLKFKCLNKGHCCNINCLEKAKIKKNVSNFDKPNLQVSF